MKLTGNKILITGGATGIGRGLTERFLQEGNTVLVCGRREGALRDLADAHPSVITRVCDLEQEADRAALYDWIAEVHPDLNVLVNNAGVQHWMTLSDDEFYNKAKTEVAINVLAPVHLTQLFLHLPALKTLINVTSGLAFVPLSKVPVYSATKAFFRSFTLSMRHLLTPRGMQVIEIIPPALNTDLGGKGLHDGMPSVAEFMDAIFEQLRAGKEELSFGFSEGQAAANNTTIAEAFNRMNP